LTSLKTPRNALYAVSFVHLWNDAFFALLFPILPLMAEELSLSYTQTGLLKTLFSGASVAAQLPAGFLSVMTGEFVVLVLGNIWVAGGLALMALSPSYVWLLGASVLGGIGGGPQHPVGSALVSKLYEKKGRSTAIGTLNFAGDVGKLIGPAFVGILAVVLGWRYILFIIAALGGVLTLALGLMRRSFIHDAAQSIDRDDGGGQESVGASPRILASLTFVGILDSATRGASLTFLPFVLVDKGLPESAIGGLFTALFAGGAVGKFACGWLGDRMSALKLIWSTELMVAGLLIAFFSAPSVALYPLAFSFGFALNGTSSVLYATVARFVPSARRTRGYAYFFTFTLGASALAPVVYGLVADAWGLFVSLAAISVMTLLILPVTLSFRRHLDQPAHVD
jgi:MFS family permease